MPNNQAQMKRSTNNPRTTAMATAVAMTMFVAVLFWMNAGFVWSKFTLVALVATVAVMFGHQVTLRRRFLTLAAVYVGWAMLSTAASGAPIQSIPFWTRLGWMAVVAVAASQLSAKQVLLGVTLTAVATSTYGLAQLAGFGPTPIDGYRQIDPGSFFGLTNFSSEWVAVALVAVLLARLLRRSIAAPQRLAWALVALLMLVYLFVAETRAVWPSLVVAVVIGLFVLRQRQQLVDAKWLAGLGAVAVIAAVVMGAPQWALKNLDAVLSGNDAPGRFRAGVWSMTLDMANDNPLLGVGPEQYSHQVDRYMSKQVDLQVGEQRKLVSSPHNELLSTLAETGYVGLLMWLGLLMLMAKALRRRARINTDDGGDDQTDEVALGMSLVALAGPAMFAFPLHAVAGTMLVAVIGGRALLRSGDEQPTAHDLEGGGPEESVVVATVSARWALLLALPVLGLAALQFAHESNHRKGMQRLVVAMACNDEPERCGVVALQEYKRAIVDFNAAVSFVPWSVATWIALGEVHARAGNLTLAISSYQRVLDLKPDAEIAYERLVPLMSKQGDSAKALEYFDRLQQLPGFRRAELFYVAMAGAYQSGRLERAIEIAQEAETRFPREGRFPLFRAQALVDLGRPEEAMEVYDIMLAKDDVEMGTMIGGSIAMAAVGRFDDAESLLMHAAEQWPYEPSPKIFLARLYWTQERRDDAFTALAAALTSTGRVEIDAGNESDPVLRSLYSSYYKDLVRKQSK